MTDKIVLVVTHGPESPELATIPFVIATAAQASDVEVVMVFQAEGMWLLRKGMAKTVAAHA
jgi:predicted peroxiredoxin